MSDRYVINVRIREGVAANPDNSMAAEVSNCDRHAISINPAGWDQLKEALVFKKPGSIMQVPAHEQLCNAQKFGVEIVLRPEVGNWLAMNVIVGQTLPLRLSLEKKDNAYLLRGEINTKAGWVKLACDDQVIPTNTWTTVGLVYSGRDMLLLMNGKVAARRVLDRPELSPLGTQGFTMGSDAEGAASFQGEVAGLRIFDNLSAELLAEMGKLLVVGVGEIESKYQALGGPQGFLGSPTAPEKKIGKGRYRTYQNGNIYWSADTGAHAISKAILQCYLAHEGPNGVLGFPMTDEFDGEKAGSRIARFEGGAIYWHPSIGAHEVHSMIFHHYLALGGEAGFLGLPKTDEMNVSGGCKNDFEGGSIFWSTQTGAHEVHDAIRQCYVSLGATSSFLGFPISDEEKILTQNGQDSGGRQARFQGGTIYRGPSLGAFEVHGAIRELYEKLGGPLGKMGYPITNETESIQRTIQSIIYYNNFQKGIIVQRGEGALEITELRLHIGNVSCGVIDDGIDWFKKDKTPELITYLTVKVNGNTLVDNQRRPSGHDGTCYDVNEDRIISPVHSDTTIYWKVSVNDWDKISPNDFLGCREETLSIWNLWGILGGNPPGVYTDQPAQKKGGDAPSLNTLKFDYSIQRVLQLDQNKHFREQFWWRFDNFSTVTLSRAQFAETFRDVEHVTNWWDKLMSPLDWAIYELLYKGLAAKGNCFGMCLHALYTRAGRSCLMEPLYQYQAAGDKTKVVEYDIPFGLRQPININHGYQLGDSAVRWYIARLGESIDPLLVYQRVKNFLTKGDYPIVTVFSLKTFDGHAVLPYKCVDGSDGQPHKIFVADPNVPWRSKEGDASYVEIAQNNTFKLVSNGSVLYQSETTLGGLLPTTFLMELPYHQVSSVPRTPFWEIIIGLALLLGGVLILVGDAETSQVSSGEKNYYQFQDGKKYVVANALPNFQHIPFLDYQGRVPELYAQAGQLPEKLVQQIRGIANGSYKRYLRTMLSGVLLDVPLTLNAQDRISSEATNGANPFYSLQTSQTEKVAQVDYYSIIDFQQGDYRRFTTNLQLAAGTEALIGLDADNGSILIKPAGPIRPVNIKYETRLGGQVKQAQLTYTPPTVGDFISVRPLDWNTPLGQIVVERLTGINGTVLERVLIPAQPVIP